MSDLYHNYGGYPFKFCVPGAHAIVGGSMSGKSTFVEACLNTPEIWSEPVDMIHWYFPIKTKQLIRLMKSHPHIEFCQGLPPNLAQPQQLWNPRQKHVAIFDDFGNKTNDMVTFTNLIYYGARHCNTALFSIDHSLFGASKERRKQSGNYHSVTCFKSAKAASQIQTLAGLYGIDRKLAKFAWDDVCTRPYDALTFDLHPDTNPNLKLVSNVLQHYGEPVWNYQLLQPDE